jgi:branched-chain amino acid transport system permease protein
MNLEIAAFLAQDGLTNGAIYALLSLALVLVFAVTRVIFVPQGEFLSFGALTLASLQAGKLPGTVWLLLGFGVAAFAFDLASAAQRRPLRSLVRSCLVNIALPVAIAALGAWLAPRQLALPSGLSADRRSAGAGAADRLGRGALCAYRPGPAVLRR